MVCDRKVMAVHSLACTKLNSVKGTTLVTTSGNGAQYNRTGPQMSYFSPVFLV